jgi:ABC-type transporter Mla subunit MlaD
MSVKTVESQVVTSVDNFLALVNGVVGDVKSGKPVATVVGDAVPELVAALASLGDVAADIADRKDLLTTIALRLAELANLLLG